MAFEFNPLLLSLSHVATYGIGWFIAQHLHSRKTHDVEQRAVAWEKKHWEEYEKNSTLLTELNKTKRSLEIAIAKHRKLKINVQDVSTKVIELLLITDETIEDAPPTYHSKMQDANVPPTKADCFISAYRASALRNT